MRRLGRCLSWRALGALLALMVATLAIPDGADAQWVCPRPNPDPGCPQLASPYATLPGSLSVPTRWGGLEEAPSLADTTLVCEGANQQFFALWRRHERASDCVWIDQGNLTLRSGAVFDMMEFPVITDPNTSFGLDGEVAIVENCAPPFNASDEVMDLWLDFDERWTNDFGTTVGIMAIHVKRLIDEDGDSCARGIVAEIGDPAMPWLMVSDPQDLCDQSAGDCQYNERSLAHEFGHLCGLTHVVTAGRLMVTGGGTDDTTLTQAEIDACRQYINDNAGTFDFDVAPMADFVAVADRPAAQKPAQDAAFDVGDDTKGGGAADMRKILIQRDETGGLVLHVMTDGLMADDAPAEYIFAIDIDNNPRTGSGLGGLFGDDRQVISGVEWVGAVRVDLAPRPCTELQPRLRVATAVDPGVFDRSLGRGSTLFREAPRFTEIEHPLLTATYRTSCMVICDFDERSDIHTHVELPVVQRLTMRLPGELVSSTGPLRVQIFGRDMNTGEVDALPDTPAEMTFERPEFPSIRLNPREARAGDTVQVDVAGMRPKASLHTLLGATEIATGEVIVGQDGRASILMPVPSGTPTGPHLVTVGANVFTADDILQVVERAEPKPPQKPRELFELLVSYEDLLRRQAIQLDKFSDLIRRFDYKSDDPR